jgi:RNA polymerase sigma-70 factor (ECF subfamily)
MPSDHDLIQLVRARDPTAFEALLARYREPVRRHLGRILRDDAAAEDVTQEAFLRVWTNADQWNGRGAFKAWLFRIATNLALNHLRAARRRPQQPLENPPDVFDEEGEELPAPGWLVDTISLGPESALEQSERAAYRQNWRAPGIAGVRGACRSQHPARTHAGEPRAGYAYSARRRRS